MTDNQANYAVICDRYPGVSVFAQHWWLSAVCQQWGAAIVTNGDAVKAVWAYALEQKLGVKLLRTPPLTPYLGPQVFFPADIKRSNRDGFVWEAVTELLQLLPQVPYWHLAVEPGLKQVGSLTAYGLHVGAKQTFMIDLQPELPVLLGNMKDTVRKNIRQAEAEMQLASEPGALQYLYQFHKATLQKKNRDIFHSLNQMERLLDACLANNAGTVYSARQGREVLAVIWHVWDGQRGYYFMGAQNPAGNNYKAITALIWHAIKETRQRNIPFFDLEGSMDPGVERFYRGFGAERELYLVLQRNTSLLWKLKEWVSR